MTRNIPRPRSVDIVLIQSSIGIGAMNQKQVGIRCFFWLFVLFRRMQDVHLAADACVDIVTVANTHLGPLRCCFVMKLRRHFIVRANKAEQCLEHITARYSVMRSF